MRTVQQYYIPFGDDAVIKMPVKSRILKARITEKGIPGKKPPVVCVWASGEHDSTETFDQRFKFIGSSHPIPDEFPFSPFAYFDTLFDGALVWHLFIEK